MLVTDRTASNGNPIVVSIKRQGRDSSGRVATTLVTVYPRDRIKQTVLSAQESNNLRYIRGSRRGLSGYKHTGASYLNASLTDTFNSLRVNTTTETPRTTFKSGKPPSLFLQKNPVQRYWIDSNVWNPRFLAAMILSGSAVHLNGLASLSLYSAMKRLIAA